MPYKSGAQASQWDGAALNAHLERVRELGALASFEIHVGSGQFQYSQGMRQIFEWESGEIGSLNAIASRLHPEDVESFWTWIAVGKSAAANVLEAQFRAVAAGSEARQLHFRGRHLVAEDGSRRFVCTVQDITEWVLGLEAARERMLLSQGMFDHATWGMFQTSHDGRYLNANPALAAIYGYDSPASLMSGFTDIGRQLYVDPTRRDEFVRRMQEDGRVSGFESQIYRRDGTVIWICENCRAVRGSDGRFLYYEGMVEEITARKNAEAELSAAKALEEEQNERFESALDNMSQGLCMFGPDRRMIVTNKRFLDIYGFSSDQLRAGMTVEEILALSPAFGDREEERMARAIAEHVGLSGLNARAVINQELANGRIITITHEPMANGGFVDTFTDMTEQRLAEARIAHMAHHDPLTDLPNRALFRQRLEAALHRVPRGEPCAVLCLDLDQFKAVNDTLGHPVGDALLKAVTERLRLLVRATDTVARLGGDEFAIVQSTVQQPMDATILANRLLRELSAPYDIAGHHVVIGTSIGIVLAPQDGTDPDQLLKSADMALYRAKSEGRNRYRYFEPEMDALMQARRALELELRKAVIAQEFELYYQPQVDLRTNRITCLEALIRWPSPTRGMVPPSEFIPLAEEIGLISHIGEWVLEAACKEAVKWPHQTKVAVNVSAVQFKNARLLQTVIEALENSGLAPNRLELEITETVMMEDSTAALALLQQIQDLGVLISMDDFGTGYSSLSYLRSFSFDKIKIDQSFVQELGNKADSIAIVRAVTGLCDTLGMRVTAEGVETIEQLNLLRDECCTEIQGYLMSRPCPASEVVDLIQNFVGHPDLRQRETALS